MRSAVTRIASSQARAELGRSLPNYFRSFTTTQAVAIENNADANNAPNRRPLSLRQRSQAAASEITRLVKPRLDSGAGAGAGANRPPASTINADSGVNGAARPKVLDVRSLPRGGLGRGRGGQGGFFRGRGGLDSQGQSGRATSAGAPGSNRFSRAGPGGRGGGFIRAGGRGRGRGRGGSGSGAPRGGRGRGGSFVKRGSREGAGDRDTASGGKRQDRFTVMDPVEEEFDNAMRFGTAQKYVPSLDMESLAPYAPAIASTAAGRQAAVMQNLSALGAADPVGASQGLNARAYAENVQQMGIRYFADVKAKEAAERYLQQQQLAEKAKSKESSEGTTATEDGTPAATTTTTTTTIISAAEDAIRKVILDEAVIGVHEAPKPASDPLGVARMTHLRSETYRAKDVESFDKKLNMLLRKTAGASGKKARKPEAKA